MSTQLFSGDAPLELLEPSELTLHPVVFMFPELSTADFDALVNSVRAHGQIDPVWITNENEVIDGRHRWMAQKKLGAKVQCRRLKNYKPELLTSIIDHCIAQNINRRHMNKDQRAVVAASMEKKRIEAVAAQERGELSLDGGTGFSWQTFEELLATFRVPKTYYTNGKQLVDYGAPELVDACANGTLSLSTALYGARKTMRLNSEEVKECLSQEDPTRAIIDMNRAKFGEKKAQRFREIFPNYVPPSPAYDLLSNMYTKYYFTEEDEIAIRDMDFSGIWEESPEETKEILDELKTNVRVKKLLIAKLNAARRTCTHTLLTTA